MVFAMAMPFCATSVVGDVLQQHGVADSYARLRVLGVDDLDSRRAEEAASRRNEAAVWLRNMIEGVAAKDLPADPSEEELRLALRSGIILCNVLNKVKPGAVPKVVESPVDCSLVPDGAALSVYQYFENVRNFLVAAQEIGVPTFEVSDLEQGGISARVVNSILALKSYHEWRQTGRNGVWKFNGNVKPTMPMKQFVRKKSEPFTNPFSKNFLSGQKFMNTPSNDSDSNSNTSARSLRELVHSLLLDKKPEEVPELVESVLRKVVEEFERREKNQNEQVNQEKQMAPSDFTKSHGSRTCMLFARDDTKAQDASCILDQETEKRILKQQVIFDKQGKYLRELKQSLSATKSGMQFMKMKFLEELSNIGMHIHSLAHAASSYHRVIEENRKLYNEVQDLKGNIRVYCRIRPSLTSYESSTSTIEDIEGGNITIKTPSKYGKSYKCFSFNKVFGPSASQEEVFADMQPLIRSVLDGYNVCIFAYGQTGSGKTYTMTGPRDLTEQTQGVNYRSLSDFFYLVEQRKDNIQYEVSVQMIEIYNEQVRDLLVDDGLNRRLEIRNSSQNGLNVPNANLLPVASTSDVITLMNLGQRNRAVGSTALNDRSSRSHSCLTVHVQGRDMTLGTTLRGCMHLVDLAGSERVNKSEVTGERLKEAQHINKSLSALGDVIASLAQKNSHVPYRNSKLTQLLQDSLGGHAKALMFVHISPEPDAVCETLSTLKFAERVASVELGAAKINKETAEIKKLKEQLANLKAALAKKDGDSVHSYRLVPCTPERCTPKAKRMSTIQSWKQGAEVSLSCSLRRLPMGDVGNLETCTNSTSRQILQSFDPDELLRNSPPCPSLDSPEQRFSENGKDIDSGEWIDKVMVNKLEAGPRLLDSLARWDSWQADNGCLSNSFFQRYLPNSPKMYADGSYGRINTDDHVDELDGAASSSSEPDLLWEFNHSRLPTFVSGTGTKAKKLEAKSPKSPEPGKSMIPTPTPSPSRNLANGLGTPSKRSKRQLPASVESRTNGNRK